MRRFLAFDIETAKILPEGVNDILEHRPLGVTCAAAVAADLAEPLVWHGGTRQDPSPSMNRGEVAALVSDLERRVEEGYTIVTWNGLGFDFDVLAEEGALRERCASLARRHVDMFFHAFCALGHFIGLQKAAEGMGLPGKTAGMSGARAPELWAAGRHAEVLQYCVQDVRTTLEVARLAEEQHRLQWRTRNGGVRPLELPSGWLSVEEAGRLPLPDTSWMANPPSRDRFTAWFDSAGR
jgi:hypothetical protein